MNFKYLCASFACLSLLASAEEFVITAGGIEVNQNSEERICQEVSAPDFVWQLYINTEEDLETTAASTLSANLKFKVSEKGVKYAVVALTGIKDPGQRGKLVKMIHLFVVSRCMGLSYELGIERALHEARSREARRDREKPSQTMKDIAEISLRYKIPAEWIFADSSLRQTLGLSPQHGSSDYLVADGGLILWFEGNEGRFYCTPVDRRLVMNPQLSRFVRDNQEAIDAKLRSLICEVVGQGREDGSIIASELKLYWRALGEVCKQQKMSLLTADITPNFDTLLIAN